MNFNGKNAVITLESKPKSTAIVVYKADPLRRQLYNSILKRLWEAEQAKRVEDDPLDFYEYSDGYPDSE